jgi:hypothetical protein
VSRKSLGRFLVGTIAEIGASSISEQSILSRI